MAHHTVRGSYDALVQRLNRYPQGAPPSELLNRILALLVSEREAGLLASLPLTPFTVAQAARAWKLTEDEARPILEELAGRAVLLDMEFRGRSTFMLPPPMAGFFEFSLMRVRTDIDQKALSELFHQYLNQEEDFVRELFVVGDTKLGRAFVAEPRIRPEDTLVVLDHERASEIVRTASVRAVGVCYCRHKMAHVGRDCDAPKDICLTFNTSAASLVKYGHAREIDVAEGLDLLARARDHGLVQFGENVREGVNFICNCCGCCCEALLAARRFALLQSIATTGFLPEVNGCEGCGRCVRACPVEGMVLVSANDPAHPRRMVARVDPQRCLGCGVCAGACQREHLTMVHQGERRLTPRDSAHRTVLMALERGTLAELVFADQVLLHHRALAAVFSVLFSLPPVKQALASRQLKSRYFEEMLTRLVV